MAFIRAESTLRSILGDKVFKEFKGVFDPCCNETNPCCPTEKYSISAEETGCAGGSPVYRITAVPITSLQGNISITILASQDDATFGFKGVTGYEGGVEVGGNYTNAGNIPYTAGHTWNIFIVDSRGNWSNTISINTQAC